MLGSWIRR